MNVKEMQELYNQCSRGSEHPEFAIFGSEETLRNIYGDEVVDEGFKKGTITYMTQEEQELKTKESNQVLETNLKVTEEEIELGKRTQEQILKPNYRNMRNQLYHFSQMIDTDLSKTRELSLARTKMQEAMFWISQELEKSLV